MWESPPGGCVGLTCRDRFVLGRRSVVRREGWEAEGCSRPMGRSEGRGQEPMAVAPGRQWQCRARICDRRVSLQGTSCSCPCPSSSSSTTGTAAWPAPGWCCGEWRAEASPSHHAGRPGRGAPSAWPSVVGACGRFSAIYTSKRRWTRPPGLLSECPGRGVRGESSGPRASPFPAPRSWDPVGPHWDGPSEPGGTLGHLRCLSLTPPPSGESLAHSQKASGVVHAPQRRDELVRPERA